MNIFYYSVDSNWLQSSRAISGLFGLSINLNENPNTAIPKYSVRSSLNETTNIRYASIPNEIVCTENLTPWIKLLPCGKNKGLSQLLKNSPKLFESHYFMASLHFKRRCLVILSNIKYHKISLINFGPQNAHFWLFLKKF